MVNGVFIQSYDNITVDQQIGHLVALDLTPSVILRTFFVRTSFSSISCAINQSPRFNVPVAQLVRQIEKIALIYIPFPFIHSIRLVFNHPQLMIGERY